MAESGVAENFGLYLGLDASEFVLHREGMLLLDQLVEAGPNSTVCKFEICRDDIFVLPDFGVPAYFGIEFMAQCIAVHAGVRARADGLQPPLGFLLGTRHYEANVSHFGIGMSYKARCTELMRDEQGMGSYECEILLGREALAAGRLVVLEKRAGKGIDE